MISQLINYSKKNMNAFEITWPLNIEPRDGHVITWLTFERLEIIEI